LAQVVVAVCGVVVAMALLFHSTGNALFFHTVPEGHVGVYKRWGAILQTTSSPGLHYMNPLTTSVDFIQVTLQTDTVTNIPCGTSGGVTIVFDKIEVVNRLDRNHVFQTVRDYGVNYDKIWIFDKIHHEINQFCSSHSLHEVYIDKFDKLDESLASAIQDSCDQYDTGIAIIAIRVTKPKIPQNILKEFEAVEAQKTHLLVLQQEQAAAKKAAETKALQEQIVAEKEATIAKIEAQKNADVSRINQLKLSSETEAEAERKKLVSKIKEEQLTLEKKGQADRERIDNQLRAEKESMETQLFFERKQKELQIQKEQLTPEYLTLRMYEEMSKAIGQNTKIYFGNDIPKTFLSLFPPSHEISRDVVLTEKE